MPVDYEIDLERERISTRCHGAVTLEEVIDHFRVLEADPDRPERLDVLLDLSEVERLPDHRQIRAVASEVERLVTRVKWQRCGIVAPRDAVFGISRMFEMLAEDHFASLKVFRTYEDATSWLDHRPGSRRG